ncbi:hypothetical protein [Gemmata massiliana]|uniref:hypothetical protein n=1 Tax=Gemmata massiliana TaxID=1210884 RepID=UPI0013A69352|nr:hypothetical protein [Gemmata massiliana]
MRIRIAGGSAGGRGDGIVRLFQNILLVIGAPALGVLTCGLGLASVMAATVFRTRAGQDPSLDWGGAASFLCFGLCGSAFGAIAGLVLAVRRINFREGGPWGPAIWIGVVLGVAGALAVRFSGALDRYVPGNVIRWGPGLACFLAACGTLGGLLGSSVETRRGHPERRKRRPRHPA